MNDQIDQAIAGAERQVSMVEIPLTLPSGRPVVLAIPADITGLELINLVGWLTADRGGLRETIEQMAAPRSRLIVPRR